jgi:hypothetical protein
MGILVLFWYISFYHKYGHMYYIWHTDMSSHEGPRRRFCPRALQNIEPALESGYLVESHSDCELYHGAFDELNCTFLSTFASREVARPRCDHVLLPLYKISCLNFIQIHIYPRTKTCLDTCISVICECFLSPA